MVPESREVVDAPPLGVFKVRLDGAVNNLMKHVPAHCRGVNNHTQPQDGECAATGQERQQQRNSPGFFPFASVNAAIESRYRKR